MWIDDGESRRGCCWGTGLRGGFQARVDRGEGLKGWAATSMGGAG